MHPEMSGYSERNFNVFYNNMLIPNADFVGFKDLGEGWAKDMHKVFYMGQIVAGADPFFFKILGSGYAKDHDHVYQYGRILPGVDPFNIERALKNGTLNPQPIGGRTIIHHHHPSPVSSYTSSVHPIDVLPSYTSPVNPIDVLPPPPPIPILPTNTITTHVDIPHRTIGGQIIRTHDSIDCCILI